MTNFKIPKEWIKYSSFYLDGIDFAKGEYEDEIEYDPNLEAYHLEESVRKEAFIQGYFDFWKSINFGK